MVRVLNESNMKDVDEDTVTVTSLQFSLEEEKDAKKRFDPVKDIVVAEKEHDGEIVAFGYCTRAVGLIDGTLHICYYQFGYVLPEYRGQGIGSALLDFTEARSRTIAAENGDVNDDRPKRLGIMATEGSPARQAFCEKREYNPRRFFYLLGLNLSKVDEDKLSTRVPPEGVTIQRGITSEEEAFATYRAKFQFFKYHFMGRPEFSDVDAKHWVLSPDNDYSLHRLAWATKEDGSREIVGIIFNAHDEENNKLLGVQRGWITHLGVHEDWRGRGLGGALIYDSLRMFKERKLEDACLGVDGENPTNAMRTYKNLGFDKVENNSIILYHKTL